MVLNPFMFDLEKFRKITNETSELIKESKNKQRNDLEEIEMRIDSNTHALHFMANTILDPKMKELAQSMISSLNSKVEITEENIVNQRIRKETKDNELIDKEILRGSKELKNMANKFTKSLQVDKEVLSSAMNKMNKNSQESNLNLKSIESYNKGIRTSTYFYLTILLFFIVYFIIRFL